MRNDESISFFVVVVVIVVLCTIIELNIGAQSGTMQVRGTSFTTLAQSHDIASECCKCVNQRTCHSIVIAQRIYLIVYDYVIHKHFKFLFIHFLCVQVQRMDVTCDSSPSVSSDWTWECQCLSENKYENKGTDIWLISSVESFSYVKFICRRRFGSESCVMCGDTLRARGWHTDLRAWNVLKSPDAKLAAEWLCVSPRENILRRIQMNEQRRTELVRAYRL